MWIKMYDKKQLFKIYDKLNKQYRELREYYMYEENWDITKHLTLPLKMMRYQLEDLEKILWK